MKLKRVFFLLFLSLLILGCEEKEVVKNVNDGSDNIILTMKKLLPDAKFINVENYNTASVYHFKIDDISFVVSDGNNPYCVIDVDNSKSDNGYCTNFGEKFYEMRYNEIDELKRKYNLGIARSNGQNIYLYLRNYEDTYNVVNFINDFHHLYYASKNDNKINNIVDFGYPNESFAENFIDNSAFKFYLVDYSLDNNLFMEQYNFIQLNVIEVIPGQYESYDDLKYRIDYNRDKNREYIDGTPAILNISGNYSGRYKFNFYNLRNDEGVFVEFYIKKYDSGSSIDYSDSILLLKQIVLQAGNNFDCKSNKLYYSFNGDSYIIDFSKVNVYYVTKNGVSYEKKYSSSKMISIYDFAFLLGGEINFNTYNEVTLSV